MSFGRLRHNHENYHDLPPRNCLFCSPTLKKLYIHFYALFSIYDKSISNVLFFPKLNNFIMVLSFIPTLFYFGVKTINKRIITILQII